MLKGTNPTETEGGSDRQDVAVMTVFIDDETGEASPSFEL